MKIVNVGLLAHVDAGKTTLTEQLLYQSGATRQAGSVDDGTAQTDFLQFERERGISVQAAAASILWKDVRINLIDMPGHADFAAEVERTLAAVDVAVLILSSVEGIQAQTELLYESLRRTKTNLLFFINKLDRTGSHAAALPETLHTRFGVSVLPFSRPLREGERGCAVESRGFADADFCGKAAELLAEGDDALLERYLSDIPLTGKELSDSFCRQFGAGKVCPLLMGSAAEGVGVTELLDFLAAYAVPVRNREDDKLSGVIYKLTHDKTMGPVAHVRLFGGTIRSRDRLVLPLGEQKVTQIRRYNGAKMQDAGEVGAGDIAALYGLSSARVCDVIGEAAELCGAELSTPLFRLHAVPASPEETFALKNAFSELSAEDPKLELQINPDNGELDINVTGTIQLEVLRELVKERYGLCVSFSEPTVIYRETPAKPGHGFNAYTMPKPCWAVVGLDIQPLPRGSGLEFASVVQNDRMFYRYQKHVETAVGRALKQGLWNWEVVDLRVVLSEGEHHTVHTHPLDFFLCTPIAVMKGLQDCGTTLLEPMRLLRIVVPEEYAGRVMGDVIAMRGECDSPVIRDGTFSAEALVPVATSLDYGVKLAAATGGKSVISMRFSGWRECPPELARPAVRRGVNPLDRDKWILANRSAMQV